jgi:hypothetical protein
MNKIIKWFKEIFEQLKSKAPMWQESRRRWKNMGWMEDE